MFLATKKRTGAAVWFSFTKANRRVTCYYFYLWDDDFGPAFVKVCAWSENRMVSGQAEGIRRSRIMLCA